MLVVELYKFQLTANLKNPFIELNNTKKRGYGGKRLLFKVDALKIKEAISKNIISTDIKIWDEKLNLVSVDEILSGGCDDNLGDDSLGGGGLGGGAIDGVGGRSGKVLQIWIEDDSENKKRNTNDGLQNIGSTDDKNTKRDRDSGVATEKSVRGCGGETRECSKLEREEKSIQGICGNGEIYKERARKTSDEIKNRKISIEDIEKMNKIRAVNELRAVPNGFSKTLWGKNIAAKFGVSLKTLYVWAKKCDELAERTKESDENSQVANELLKRKSGLSEWGASQDEIGIDFKAVFSSSSFDMSALEWAVGFMLHNPLATKMRAYEELKKKAKKESWSIGSYKSFARQMDKAEIKAMLLRATAGDRGVRNEIATHIKRDLNCYESMELVCGDQIVFDFNAICPMGEVVNPNAYVWIDMGSGAIIGVDVVFGKYNRLGVGRSLKMALKFGVAEAIYTDNGKPELSNYIKEIRSQLSGIKFKDFEDLNPTLLHKKARPANSRAKPIENIFNHVQRWMMEDIICEKGGSSYHKDNRKNSEIMKKYMKANPLNYEKFINYFAKAIKKWNEHYNSSRKIVPMEAFLTKLENITRFDDTTLEYIFSERRKIKVRHSTVSIQRDGVRRTYYHPVLSKYNGEEMEIRLDEKDMMSVVVVDMDKNLPLVTAHLQEKLDPRDSERVSAAIEKNELVVKAVRDAFNYYKNLHKKPNSISSYSGVAHKTKVKNEKRRELEKNIVMSNEEITARLMAM